MSGWWIWISVGGLVGSGMVILGLRKRYVGDHPHCRKCGFDLFGRNESSVVCSECGADLNARKAIVIGVGRRRYALLLPGLLILVATLGWSGWKLRGIDPTPYKPDWWMAREARSPDAPTRVAAILELTRRLNNRELSNSRVESLVKHALQVQADQSQTWLPEWGDFVQDAFAARNVTDVQWERYIRQAVEVKLVPRARVRKGDPLPLSIEQKYSRLGKKPVHFFEDEYELDIVRPSFNFRGYSQGARSTGSGGRSQTLLHHQIEHLAPGNHRVAVAGSWLTWYADRVAPEFEVSFRAQWELLPPEQPSVQLVDNSELKASLEKELGNLWLEQNARRPDRFTIRTQRPKFVPGFAHDVFIRVQDKEWKFGDARGWSYRSRVGPGLLGFGLGWSGVVPGMDVEKVDIILRPNIEIAAGTIDIFELSRDELVLDGVPVKYASPAATKPAAAKTVER